MGFRASPFAVGAILGFVLANIFCFYSSIDMQGTKSRTVSRYPRRDRNISGNGHSTKLLAVESNPFAIKSNQDFQKTEQQNWKNKSIPREHAVDTPKDYKQELYETERSRWNNMSLDTVYPPSADGQPNIRADSLPPDACVSNGLAVSRTWILESETNPIPPQISVSRSMKPDPPQTPYRGHVKVCMGWHESLWWQGYWKEFGTCRGDDYCDLPCGNIHCRYVWKKERWNECSAFVMHHGLRSPFRDIPYSRSVLTITEPLYKPDVADALADHHKELRKDIDIVAQWTRAAHIYIPAHNNQFLPGGEPEFIRHQNFSYLSCPPKPEVAEKTCVERRMGVTVFNHGNCASKDGKREDYVRELQKYVHVDAYGGCLHNKDRPGGGNNGKWRYQHEVELRSHYKFSLAFENQITEDFVTEKVYDALAAGSVPIYYGVDNIYDFIPCTNCIIETRKFSGPQELAKYLIYLDQNPAKYMEYHAWRDKPFKVPRLMEVSKAYLYCGVCKAVADDIEGNLTHLEWNAERERWVPDPSRKPKPTPPNWARGFDD